MDFVRRVVEDSQNEHTFHFFQRDFDNEFTSSSFSCYGTQAQQLALEYYKSARVLRNEHGLDCLNTSMKLFSKIVTDVMEKQLKVKVWRRTKPLSATWEVIAEGSQNSFHQLENELGIKLVKDSTLSYFIAGIWTKSSGTGLVLLSTPLQIIKLYQFIGCPEHKRYEMVKNTLTLPNLVACCRFRLKKLLSEHEVRQAVVMTVDSDSYAQNLLKGLEKALQGISILVIRDNSPSVMSKDAIMAELRRISVPEESQHILWSTLQQDNLTIHAAAIMLQKYGILDNNRYSGSFRIELGKSYCQ
jgi:hypothetical protein